MYIITIYVNYLFMVHVFYTRDNYFIYLNVLCFENDKIFLPNATCDINKKKRFK